MRCAALLGFLAASCADAPAPRPAATDPTDSIRPTLAGLLSPTGELIGLVNVGRDAVVPVLGVDTTDLRDSFGAPRADERRHVGIDIPAPIGTPIGAAVDGWIEALSSDDAGGLGLVQHDRSGQLRLYYAHLSAYAQPMYAGRAVRRGELIGYVGDTGNARGSPHLHFQVARVHPRGDVVRPINPYLFLTGR